MSDEDERRLKPKEGFGKAVYELMIRRRRSDGSAWRVSDLVKALKERGAEVTGASVRSWIRDGVVPKGPTLGALAALFDVDADQLIKGESKPINLPQGSRSANGSGREPAPGAPRAPGRRATDQHTAEFKAAARTMIGIMRLHHDAMRPYFDMLEILLLGSTPEGKGIHDYTEDLRAGGAFTPSEALKILAGAAAHAQTQPPAGQPHPTDEEEAVGQ